MRSSVGLALPGLLVGLLCLLSVCGELSREQHSAVQAASVFSLREELEEDVSNVNRLVVDDRLVGRDSPSSSERRRADYDDSRQVRDEAGQNILRPRSAEQLQNSAGQVDGSGVKADLPCPVAAAIAPCVCFTYIPNTIGLDCSLVESEEQLANVFQQEFPVKELWEFRMEDNKAIKVLGNILNGISFERVYITSIHFTLEEISDYFLLASKDSLSYLEIYGSLLTSDHFPFAVLDGMDKLQGIWIDGSSITWIPPILAPNIRDMFFSHGKTEILKSGTFPIHAGPVEIWIDYNNISTVEPGSFYWADANSITNNAEVFIVLQGNRIEFLEAGTFVFRDGPMRVWLSNNEVLASIAPGTFVMPPTTDSFTFTLSLYNNQMETFDEDVFGELMPYTRQLHLGKNPLLCGCDIAWLVTNADYMSAIDEYSTCANGTNLHDLDPAVYEAVC